MTISESVPVLFSSKACVIERFYDRLLTKYPDLRRHFESRDMKMQASMLTVALASVEAYFTHRFPATEHYLHVLGHRHFHEGVKADDFPKFQAVLLETLAEFFGNDWDEELAAQWHEALDVTIAVMSEGYTETYTM